MLGSTIAHYEILARLGAGGMGEVYVARDTSLDRKVALKILPAEWAEDAERRRRFEREAKAVAALNHPNIVTVYSVEEEAGVHFITMELVEGEPLDRVTPPSGLSSEAFLDLAVPLADALAEAHEQGIVHRDLKPANIMVDGRGRPKILDFGLVRWRKAEPETALSMLPTEVMTEAGRVVGTYPYMSPEQAEGGEVDHRSDLFSLGIVFYEMATGRRPFHGKTPMSLVSSILRDEPRPVQELRRGLPERLGRIIAGCLEKDPARRPQGAAELRDRLEELRSGDGPAAWGEAASDLEETVTLGGEAGAARAAPPAAGRLLRPGTALKAGAAALVLVVAAVVLQRFLPAGGRQPAAGAPPRTAALAVLPLENLSGDPEQEYFADGMTDALITDLSKIDALKVISRSSVMPYKGAGRRPAEVARELGVDTLMTGSVLREGDRVAISAQLVEAESERTLWADRYEQELTSVLALQAEVARAIAQAVEVELTPEEASQLAGARRVDAETYESYLKGRYYLNQFTPEGVGKGLRALQEAIDRDPTEPLLWAGLAIAYSDIGHAPTAPADSFARSRAAAERALELDDAVPEAHAALGEVKLMHDWDYRGAELAFQRALGLESSLARTYSHYGWLHYLFGRWDETLAAFRRAKEVDPLTPFHSAYLGWVLWWEGLYEEATAEADRALDLRPGSPMALALRGLVAADQKRYDEALADHRQAVAIAPVWSFALGYTYAVAGMRDEALAVAAQLGRSELVFNAWGLAEIYTALGDHDRALDWLEAAYAGRHSWMPWIDKASTFDPLHGEPRFEELVRKMDLPDRRLPAPAPATVRSGGG